MVSNNPLFIGIFLGYSILQVLEYGVSGIISQTVMFQDFLARRNDNLTHESHLKTPEKDGSQIEDRSVENDIQLIDLVEETMQKTRIECEEKIKAIEREIREIKMKMEI